MISIYIYKTNIYIRRAHRLGRWSRRRVSWIQRSFRRRLARTRWRRLAWSWRGLWDEM